MSAAYREPLASSPRDGAAEAPSALTRGFVRHPAVPAQLRETLEQSAAVEAAWRRQSSAQSGLLGSDWFLADQHDRILESQASPTGILAQVGPLTGGCTNDELFARLLERIGPDVAVLTEESATSHLARQVAFRDPAGRVTYLAALTLPRYDDRGELSGSRTLIAVQSLPAGFRWPEPEARSAPQSSSAPSGDCASDQEQASAAATSNPAGLAQAEPASSSGAEALHGEPPGQPAPPATLCAVPWLNLSLDVDGTVRPCCMFAHLYGEEGAAYGNLKTHSLPELWNSPGMVALRQQFRAGEKPAPCRRCWDEESAGIRSFRQTFEPHRVRGVQLDFDNFTPAHPITLDLKLSNRCNLKCRICSPLASTLFLAESLRHRDGEPEFLEYLTREQDYLQSNKITRQEHNLAEFRRWLPHLQHIELFGGETTISDEVEELERLMVDGGYAGNISLLFNTNITVFSPPAIERWRRFRRVDICLSLDDIEQRLEFQRHPARWEKVRANVAKYAELAEPNIRVTLFCSVSSYNVYYLPEIARWAMQHCPTLELALNYVHYDPPFCVKHMPPGLKQTVRARLLAVAAELENWPEPSPGNRIEQAQADRAREASERLRDAAGFIASGEADPAQWQIFLRRTAELDRLRGESFAEVFPELHQLIQAEAAQAAAG